LGAEGKRGCKKGEVAGEKKGKEIEGKLGRANRSAGALILRPKPRRIKFLIHSLIDK